MNRTGAAKVYDRAEGVDFSRIQRVALIIGVVGVVLCVVGAIFDIQQFFRSYLWAYIYWMGLGLGCTALAMVQHLVGGKWGASIRRFLESGSSTVPWMAVLFVPVLFGIPYLYEWSHEDVVATDQIIQLKSAYLNTPFFIIRAIIYLVVWAILAVLLNRWSTKQDSSGGDARYLIRMRQLSAAGLVLYMLTMTFAGFDWGMSLEPHWFSTIYSVILIIGQGLMAFSLSAIMLWLTSKNTSYTAKVGVQQIHDIGNFMLGFTMLWTYMSLSQFIIIYSANLPEEVTWYLSRTAGGWWTVARMVVVLQFLLPFFLLLQRPLKRNPAWLARIAMLVMAAYIVHIFWFITPAFTHGGGFHFHWLDAATILALGGLWVAGFLWMLGRRPLLPLHDHRLVEAHGHH